LPAKSFGMTQVVTKSNGERYLAPPPFRKPLKKEFLISICGGEGVPFICGH